MKRNHSCLFNHELLVAYVTRNVEPGERVEVERHLAHCAECRHEVKELEQTWLALDAWSENAETARPRINDLRLRLKAAQPKPSMREVFWKKMEIFSLPWRLVPASPVLAVIVTGVFAYAGWQTQWGTAPASDPVKPSMAANSQEKPAIPVAYVPAFTMKKRDSITEPDNQVNRWDTLVQNTNLRYRPNNVLIRMATDGLDYVHYTGSASRDVLPTYPDSNLVHSVSMKTLNGELVRLE